MEKEQPVDTEPLAVAFDRRQMLGMVGAGSVFVVVGVLLVLYGPAMRAREHPILLQGLGVFCVAFFGGWSLVAARHLFSIGPALVVDDEGILDAASLLRAGRIPWAEIAGFRATTFTGQRLLVVRLRRADAVARRAPLRLRPVGWLCQRLFGSPVVVPLTLLRGVGSQDLLATCRRRRKAAKARATSIDAAPSPGARA